MLQHPFPQYFGTYFTAVVCRVAGLVDNPMGDLLELDASHLSKEVGFQLHHSFGERTSDGRGQFGSLVWAAVKDSEIRRWVLT